MKGSLPVDTGRRGYLREDGLLATRSPFVYVYRRTIDSLPLELLEGPLAARRS